MRLARLREYRKSTDPNLDSARPIHNRAMHTFRVVRTSVLAALTCAALFATAAGREEMVSISGSAPKTVHGGSKLNAKVHFAVPSGFHIYAPNFKGTGVPVTFELSGAPAGFKVLAAKAPKGGELSGKITMTVPIKVPASAKGKKSFSLIVHYQQCNDRICLPPTTATVSISTTVK